MIEMLTPYEERAIITNPHNPLYLGRLNYYNTITNGIFLNKEENSDAVSEYLKNQIRSFEDIYNDTNNKIKELEHNSSIANNIISELETLSLKISDTVSKFEKIEQNRITLLNTIAIERNSRMKTEYRKKKKEYQEFKKQVLQEYKIIEVFNENLNKIKTDLEELNNKNENIKSVLQINTIDRIELERDVLISLLKQKENSTLSDTEQSDIDAINQIIYNIIQLHKDNSEILTNYERNIRYIDSTIDNIENNNLKKINRIKENLNTINFIRTTPIHYEGFLAKNNVKDLIKFRRFKQSELIWQAVNIFEDNEGKVWNDVIQQDVLSQIDALQTIDQDAAQFYKADGNMWIRLKKNAQFFWNFGQNNWDIIQFIVYASADTAETIQLDIGGFKKIKIKIIYESYDIYNEKHIFSLLQLVISQAYNPSASNRPNITDLEIEHYFKTTQQECILPIDAIETWAPGINVKHRYIFCEKIDYHVPQLKYNVPMQTVHYSIECVASVFHFNQEYLNKQIISGGDSKNLKRTYKYEFNNCLVYHDINNYEMKGNSTQYFFGSRLLLKFITEKPGDLTWWTGNLKDSLPILNKGWSTSGDTVEIALYNARNSYTVDIIKFANPLLADTPQPIVFISEGLRPYINKEVSWIDKNYNFKIRVHAQTGADLFKVQYEARTLLQMNIPVQQFLILSDIYKDSIVVSSENDHFGTKSDLGFTITKLENCLLRCLFLNTTEQKTNNTQIQALNDYSQKIQSNSLDTMLNNVTDNIVHWQQIQYDKPLPNYQNTYEKILYDNHIEYKVNCDNFLLDIANRSSLSTLNSLVNRVISDTALNTILTEVGADIIGGQNLTAISNVSNDNLPNTLQYALSETEQVLSNNNLKNIQISNDYLLIIRNDIDWQGVQFTKNYPLFNEKQFVINTMENFFVLAKTEEEEYVILSILQNNVCPTVFSNARRILYTEGAYHFVKAFQIWKTDSLNLTNQNFPQAGNISSLSSTSGSLQFIDLTLKFTNTSFIIL